MARKRNVAGRPILVHKWPAGLIPTLEAVMPRADGNWISRVMPRSLDKMERHRSLRWSIYSVAAGVTCGIMACLVFYHALTLFLQTGYGRIPIEDEESVLIGILRLEDLMDAYHQQIQEIGGSH